MGCLQSSGLSSKFQSLVNELETENVSNNVSSRPGGDEKLNSSDQTNMNFDLDFTSKLIHQSYQLNNPNKSNNNKYLLNTTPLEKRKLDVIFTNTINQKQMHNASISDNGLDISCSINSNAPNTHKPDSTKVGNPNNTIYSDKIAFVSSSEMSINSGIYVYRFIYQVPNPNINNGSEVHFGIINSYSDDSDINNYDIKSKNVNYFGIFTQYQSFQAGTYLRVSKQDHSGFKDLLRTYEGRQHSGDRIDFVIDTYTKSMRLYIYSQNKLVHKENQISIKDIRFSKFKLFVEIKAQYNTIDKNKYLANPGRRDAFSSNATKQKYWLIYTKPQIATLKMYQSYVEIEKNDDNDKDDMKDDDDDDVKDDYVCYIEEYKSVRNHRKAEITSSKRTIMSLSDPNNNNQNEQIYCLLSPEMHLNDGVHIFRIKIIKDIITSKSTIEFGIQNIEKNNNKCLINAQKDHDNKMFCFWEIPFSPICVRTYCDGKRESCQLLAHGPNSSETNKILKKTQLSSDDILEITINTDLREMSFKLFRYNKILLDSNDDNNKCSINNFNFKDFKLFLSFKCSRILVHTGFQIIDYNNIK